VTGVALVRVVPPTFARQAVEPDPAFELEFAAHLRSAHTRGQLAELYDRFTHGAGDFDARMRRVIWRALAGSLGHGARIGRGVTFTHLETFEIGEGVWIGDAACLQGRFDGQCRIGNRVWIGPQSFLDARDLALGDFVGWGPGAKVVGSTHTGRPAGAPVIETDLAIRPVRVCEGADIGANAVLLPGVTVGARSVVGAGAVVVRDIPEGVIAAGVPAKVLRPR